MPSDCSTFRLTPDFRLGEFAVSDSRPDLVEQVPDDLGPNVVRLAHEVLQPIRYQAGAMKILSGYRSEALNATIGGSDTSQHRRAEAADFTCASPAKVFRWLLDGHLVVPSGQVIYYPDSVFIHAALPGTRYPTPTFFVHAPDRGLEYERVRNGSQMDAILEGQGE